MTDPQPTSSNIFWQGLGSLLDNPDLAMLIHRLAERADAKDPFERRKRLQIQVAVACEERSRVLEGPALGDQMPDLDVGAETARIRWLVSQLQFMEADALIHALGSVQIDGRPGDYATARRRVTTPSRAERLDAWRVWAAEVGDLSDVELACSDEELRRALSRSGNIKLSEKYRLELVSIARALNLPECFTIENVLEKIALYTRPPDRGGHWREGDLCRILGEGDEIFTLRDLRDDVAMPCHADGRLNGWKSYAQMLAVCPSELLRLHGNVGGSLENTRLYNEVVSIARALRLPDPEAFTIEDVLEKIELLHKSFPQSVGVGDVLSRLQPGHIAQFMPTGYDLGHSSVVTQERDAGRELLERQRETDAAARAEMASAGAQLAAELREAQAQLNGIHNGVMAIAKALKITDVQFDLHRLIGRAEALCAIEAVISGDMNPPGVAPIEVSAQNVAQHLAVTRRLLVEQETNGVQFTDPSGRT